MTRLVSQDQAASRIAAAFKRGPCCQVCVQEQRAFKDDEWLTLGTISLPSSQIDDEGDAATAGVAAFTWNVAGVDSVKSALAKLLYAGQDQAKQDHSKIASALNQIAAIGVRAGLVHPAFDPAAIEEMPRRGVTTVVSDTSGVLQGALDFVVRYLYPAIRVKIPAIAQMELVNFTDRFLKFRRDNERKVLRDPSTPRRTDELIEHLKSQGGQRVPLRLELQDDAEIERTYLLGDPLRSAFQPDKDSALSHLNISVPVAAYADRLILEAARHHQAQSPPGHAVRLLTSDQGLARMALAEGVTPLYFTAVTSRDFFGARLSSHIFHPFNGDVQSVSLTQVLWELATAFGAARLQWEDSSQVTITAMSDEVSWSLFQSLDDLLWLSETDSAEEASSAVRATSATNQGTVKSVDVSPAAVGIGVSFQRMSVNHLLRLVCELDDNKVLDSVQAGELIGVRSKTAGEYRRFLASAGLIETEDDRWVATPSVRVLSAALRNENVAAFRNALMLAPSFAAFHTLVAQSVPGRIIDVSNLSRSAATYRTLGEMALICATVGRDLFATPAKPAPGVFAQIALQRFRALDRGDGLVATGRWLEALIQHDGIHPEVSRDALEQASDAGLLRRVTEGSTTQTAFDDHVVHVLRTDSNGIPVAVPVRLYRGDYLIPGKASVSLRIEGRS